MEGPCPDKLRLVPNGCVSETLSEERPYHEGHNCKGAVRRKGHEYEVRCKSGLAQARWRGIAPTSSVGFVIEGIMDCRARQDDFANFIAVKR